MKILFIPRNKADDLMNLTIDKIDSVELEEIKSELEKIDETYSLVEVNLGEGTDWVLILAILNGVTTVFLIGDKIDKGIDGWIKIGKRIKNIFSKTDKIYLDKQAAILLGIQHLSEKYKIESIALVSELDFSIKDLSKMLLDRNSSDFIAKPYSVYLFSFKINDCILILLSVRSDGLITQVDSFNENDLVPF